MVRHRFAIAVVWALAGVPGMSAQDLDLTGGGGLSVGGGGAASFEVPFDARLPYRELLVEGRFRLGGQELGLAALAEAAGSVDEEEFGRLLFEANTRSDALSRFAGGAPLVSTLTDREIYQGVGAAFSVLLGNPGEDLDRVSRQVAGLGREASFGTKLLFLQILSSITEDIYDAGKLNPQFTWDAPGREPARQMLEAMAASVRGTDTAKGVCFDSESLMNEFSALLGLTGAYVFGPNALGMLHPEGLYFDTSDPRQTRAILHDWTKMAVVPYDTPTELADALEQVNGTHLMARVLYDGQGHPLKLIRSSGDLVILDALGHQSVRDFLSRQGDSGAIPEGIPPGVAAGAEYRGYRLEVREYASRVAAANTLVTLGLPVLTGGVFGLTYTGSTSLGLAHESQGLLSRYTLQPTNEHFKMLLRHESALTLSQAPLVPGLLSFSLHTGIEAFLGAYQHRDDTVYKSSLLIPVFEGRSAVTLSLFDRSRDGFGADLTALVSLDFLYPRQVNDILSALSTYLNAVPDEAHLAARLWWVPDPAASFFLDADYGYTSLAHEFRLTAGLTDGRRYQLSASLTGGLANSAFPFFYAAGTTGLQVSSRYLLSPGPGPALWLSLDLETSRGLSPQDTLSLGLRWKL